MFPAETVRDVQTSAIKGEYAPLDALNRMLAGTGLPTTTSKRMGCP